MREKCIDNKGLEELLTINKYYEVIPIDSDHVTILSDRGIPIKVDIYRFRDYTSTTREESIELESSEAITIINYLIDLIGDENTKEMSIVARKDYILNYIRKESLNG